MGTLRFNDEFRPVDWRWQRAKHLQQTRGRINRKRDDEHIARLRSFAIELDRALPEGQQSDRYFALYEHFPGLMEAWEIAMDSSNSTALNVRFELKARLLTRMTVEELASKTFVKPETIEWFERAFFDVRSRLDNRTFILHHVIGPKLHYGLQQRDTEQLWMIYGYFGGPHVLDWVISTQSIQPTPSSPDEVINYCQEDHRHALILKAMLSARTTPINWQTSIEMINSYQKMRELDIKSNNEAPVAVSAEDKSLQLACSALPWRLPSPGEAHDGSTTGVALRATEIVLLRNDKEDVSEAGFNFPAKAE